MGWTLRILGKVGEGRMTDLYLVLLYDYLIVLRFSVLTSVMV